MSATAYRIRHWGNGMFEHRSSNGRSAASLPWVAVPTKHDGKGYLRLAAKDPTGAIYGCWILTLAVAAKCPIRGLLADEDGPLTIDDVALKTHRSTEAMQTAFKVLTSTEIGWLESVPFDLESFRGQLARGPTALSAQPARETHAMGAPTDGTDETDSTDGFCSETETVSPAFSMKKNRPSAFASLTKRDLADTAKIVAWLKSQGKSDSPVIESPTDDDLRRVLATAERALAKGQKPVALFASIVSKRNWDGLSRDELERADARMLEYRNAHTKAAG